MAYNNEMLGRNCGGSGQSEIYRGAQEMVISGGTFFKLGSEFNGLADIVCLYWRTAQRLSGAN